jgi:hypothetical protein
MAGATRQHYALATGGALASTEKSSKVLKLAKGGRVKSGDDKFTSITHKGKHLAKGFKVQRP